MIATPETPRSPAERVDDVAAILAAMRRAVREAVLDHQRAGNPIAIWRDEQVVWIQPDDILAELARAWAVDSSDPFAPGTAGPQGR
jgi:hypothetical protein